MRKHQLAIGGIFAALLAAAVVAGCGGGGAASALPPGGGGGHPSPTPSPTGNPSPSPSPSPGASATPVILGTVNDAVGGSWPNPTEAPMKHAEIDVTCGCTNVAGTGFSDASGNFNIQTVATPVPTPNPSYTIVPGRNYMVIGTATQTGNHAQAWTMVFAGHNTAANQYLNPGVQTSDTVTAAVALWVYANSSPGSIAFDDWNFVTLQQFYTKIATNPTAQETQLLTDIVSAQIAKQSMYPAKPQWRTNRVKNSTIAADVAAINASTDPSVPTPCPGNPPVCTGTPTP